MSKEELAQTERHGNTPIGKECVPSSPSRPVRRRLERRADRLLAGLRGSVLTSIEEVSLRDRVILLTERRAPFAVERAALGHALMAVGLAIPGLAQVLAEIAADRRDDGARIPVLIVVEAWLQVAFVEARLTSGGGIA